MELQTLGPSVRDDAIFKRCGSVQIAGAGIKLALNVWMKLILTLNKY